eukprot:XP_024440940.1 hydroquinone glucosyltransferase [Populus trichocarpa]
MGQIIPLLEFSKRLVVDHDFHVSFLVITTSNEASAAQDQLLQSPTFPSGLDVVYLPPIDVFSVTTDDMLMLTRLCVMVEESLKSLKSVLKELGELRAVVIDKFFTQAFDVCCELSIPAYLFYTSAIVMLTFSLSLPTLDCEVEGEFVDLAEPLKVPGCPPFPIEDLFDPLKNRKIDEYKWLLFHSSRFHLAAGIFVNSWKELESVTYKAITEDPFFKQIPTPPVLPVGPLIKGEEPLTARDIEYLAWLDKQPSDSVLFVALGSGGTLTADQLTELAWGIELSHQRFVFVARKPTNSSASAAVFTAGSDIGNPVLKCVNSRDNPTIINGVPLIAWPLFAEQRMNATILAEQVGIAVKPVVKPGESLVGREEVERVVRLVIEGEKGRDMRRRTGELKESAAKALEIGGSSHDALERVAKEWKAESNV